jgi:hypothetical protein
MILTMFKRNILTTRRGVHTFRPMSDKPIHRTTLLLPAELLAQVDEFRFNHRYAARNDAIVALIRKGLGLDPEEAPRSAETGSP